MTSKADVPTAKNLETRGNSILGCTFLTEMTVYVISVGENWQYEKIKEGSYRNLSSESAEISVLPFERVCTQARVVSGKRLSAIPFLI